MLPNCLENATDPISTVFSVQLVEEFPRRFLQTNACAWDGVFFLSKGKSIDKNGKRTQGCEKWCWYWHCFFLLCFAHRRTKSEHPNWLDKDSPTCCWKRNNQQTAVFSKTGVAESTSLWFVQRILYEHIWFCDVDWFWVIHFYEVLRGRKVG